MDNFLLVEYSRDFGRMGSLDGKFLCTQDTWDKLQPKEWYASDILGKHSEIMSDFSSEGFSTRLITREQTEFLCEILKLDFEKLNTLWNDKEEYYAPTLTISGFNPVDYIREGE